MVKHGAIETCCNSIVFSLSLPPMSPKVFTEELKIENYFVFLILSRGHEFLVDLNVMNLYETIEFDQMRRLSTPSCTSSNSNYYTVWKYFCRDHFGWREYSEVSKTFHEPVLDQNPKSYWKLFLFLERSGHHSFLVSLPKTNVVSV